MQSILSRGFVVKGLQRNRAGVGRRDGVSTFSRWEIEQCVWKQVGEAILVEEEETDNSEDRWGNGGHVVS